MSSLEEKLRKVADKSFGKFCEKLAKVDPVAALLITGATITPVIGAAFYSDYLTLQELYRTGGPQALAEYQSMQAKSFSDLVSRGIAGTLPGEQNTTALGAVAMLTIPLAACVTTLAARKFQNLKDEVKLLQQGGRNIDPANIRRIEYPVRETCATRVGPSRAERFDMCLETLSSKIEQIQDAEQNQKAIPGPRL